MDSAAGECETIGEVVTDSAGNLVNLGGELDKIVLLKNGIMEWHVNGKKKGKDQKWKLVDKEIHIESSSGNGGWLIYKMVSSESISKHFDPPTYIECIGCLHENKRTDFGEKMQMFWKKPL